MASAKLRKSQDEFIAQWGVLGSAWGINRTMAQVHALLLISPESLSTDMVMERLSISRGNAHTNLKELLKWGLVRSVIKQGERKEFFEGAKDPWQLFCTVARERRRREIEPTLAVLERCRDEAKGFKDREGRAFREQLDSLSEFVSVGDRVLERVGRSEQSTVMKWLLKMMS